MDINYLGQPAEDAPFPASRFVLDQTKFDFSNYFWADLSKPAEMSLTSATSLHRAHVLWQTDAPSPGPKLLSASFWMTGPGCRASWPPTW